MFSSQIDLRTMFTFLVLFRSSSRQAACPDSRLSSGPASCCLASLQCRSRFALRGCVFMVGVLTSVFCRTGPITADPYGARVLYTAVWTSPANQADSGSSGTAQNAHLLACRHPYPPVRADVTKAFAAGGGVSRFVSGVAMATSFM